MKIAFIWQGFDGRYGHWKDGLYAAMQYIELSHEVRYYDTTRLGEIKEFNPDRVLYWEAPCTLYGKDRQNYLNVLELPYKKALLFAGGVVKPDICIGIDLYFVESRLNELEFEDLGLPWKRAFGVHTGVMRNLYKPAIYRGIMHATFAAWKRHHLFAEALGEAGCVVGRVQEHDRYGYEECQRRGVTIFPEKKPAEVAELINQSACVVNTSDFWGGGQRCTLEGMACAKPVIVMNDSPKNCEYVEESGGGIICEPTKAGIQRALTEINEDMGRKAQEYVLSKWTEKHYALNILNGLENI